MATITATRLVGTPNSTIMTRFKVPTNSTRAMPTDTWNKDKRNKRLSGKSALTASVNGNSRTPQLSHAYLFFCSMCEIQKTGQAKAHPVEPQPRITSWLSRQQLG